MALRQTHIRFRTDAGAADATPSWGADEDVDTFDPALANFRLRAQVANDGPGASGAQAWQLYASKNGGAYAPVTTTSTMGVKSADAGSSADETAITVARLTAPEFAPGDWWLNSSAIDLDFAGDRYYETTDGQVVTDYLSCSRASIGYAKTAAGTLTQFSSNELRITDLGLLVEDARTNYCAHSQDTTGWTPTGGSYPSTSNTAPDGSSTAILFTTDSSAGAHGSGNSIAVQVGSNSWSIYMKANGYNYGSLRATNASDHFSIVVNLITGAITDTHTIGTGVTNPVASTELLADGWVRLMISASVSTDLAFVWTVSDVAVPTWTADGFPTFTADGSSGIYWWGAQLEFGAFPSSYIPTTTTSATRAADAVTCVGSLNTILSGTEGSAVCDAKSDFLPKGYWRIVGDTVAADKTLISANLNLDTSVVTYDGGAPGTATILPATIGNSLAFTGGVKLGASWKTTATAVRSVVGGGGTVATDANAIAFPNATIGSGVQLDETWHGYFRRLTVWNTRLDDTTLQGFTAP